MFKTNRVNLAEYNMLIRIETIICNIIRMMYNKKTYNIVLGYQQLYFVHEIGISITLN